MGESTLERLNLYYYGTLRWQPSPRVVYETAASDLESFRNRASVRYSRSLAKAAGANPNYQGRSKNVAFLVAHLNGAKSPSDVLRAAIRGITDGCKSKNVETLYMYQSISALESALQIAQAAERDNGGIAAAE